MAGKKVIALCRKFYARVAICSATFKLLGTRKSVRGRGRERREWLIGPRAQTIKNLGCLDPVAQMARSTRTTRNSQNYYYYYYYFEKYKTINKITNVCLDCIHLKLKLKEN
jgi:hypothetical protein